MVVALSWARLLTYACMYIQYYKPLESIDDFLRLFVQMADMPGGVLTQNRLVQVLQSSLTVAEMTQLMKMVKVRPSGSVDYAGLVAMLFEL